MKQAETTIANSMERGKDELREEVASLKNRMDMREKELGRLVGKTENFQVIDVKEEIDRLRNQVQNLESQLSLRDEELSRTSLENKVRILKSYKNCKPAITVTLITYPILVI